MLKPIEDILEPDQRFRTFVKLSDLQPMTLADHHATIEAIQLTAVTPQNVRTVFERARCAYLYAWFAYELTTLAQAQACSALELALYDHLKARYPDKEFSSLNACLEKCIADGDFDGLQIGAAEPPHNRQRLAALRQLLVSTRNEIAHGSEMVLMPGTAADVIRCCASLISHLHRA
jgi:hypothetical protein